MGSDNPIDFHQNSTPFGSPVIDLAEVRVRFGRARDNSRVCRHFKLTYNKGERRIWCDDCETTVDSFDAFMVLVENFHQMTAAANNKLQRAAEAADATLVRRAAKEIDRTWNKKMAATCPHCRGGILPEDMESHGCMSRDIELARRNREAKP